MAKRIVKELASKISETGFGFHGTLAGNLRKIRQSGLSASDGTLAYLIPGKTMLERHYPNENDIWERAVGAAYGAANYGFKNLQSQPNENTTVDVLPAIVITRRDGPELGYDEGHIIPAIRRNRSQYPSFGKVWSRNVPRNKIAAIVRLTKKEYLTICRKNQHPWFRTSAIQAKLAVKALTRLKQMALLKVSVFFIEAKQRVS